MGALRTPSLLPGCVKTFLSSRYLQRVSSIAVRSVFWEWAIESHGLDPDHGGTEDSFIVARLC